MDGKLRRKRKVKDKVEERGRAKKEDWEDEEGEEVK